MKLYTLWGDRLEPWAILQQRDRKRVLVLGNHQGTQTFVKAPPGPAKRLTADLGPYLGGELGLLEELAPNPARILVVVRVHPGVEGALDWYGLPGPTENLPAGVCYWRPFGITPVALGDRRDGAFCWSEALLEIPLGGGFSLKRQGSGFPEYDSPYLILRYVDPDFGPTLERGPLPEGAL